MVNSIKTGSWVRSIAVVYDDGDADRRDVADSLRRHAPAGFDCRPVALAAGATAPAAVVDSGDDIHKEIDRDSQQETFDMKDVKSVSLTRNPLSANETQDSAFKMKSS